MSKFGKKRDRNYQIMIVSDNPTIPTRKMKVTGGGLSLFMIIIPFLLILFIAYTSYLYYISQLQSVELSYYRDMWNAETEKVKELESQIDELSETNAIIAETLGQKVTAEAKREEKLIPTGFPLVGVATLEESSDESGQMLIFTGQKGAKVVAAGGGTVLSIKDEGDSGVVVRIDHGNGYISIYKTVGKVKVREKDELTGGTLLIEMQKDIDKLYYQIQEGDSIINPMDLLVISG